MIERCGILASGKFIEYENIADDPKNNFKLPLEALMRDDVEAIWHTHPDGYPYLSANDRLNQIATGKRWILNRIDRHNLVVDPVPLLVGREFEYGKADCGTIIEDAYMLMGIDLGFNQRNDMELDVKSNYIIERLDDCGFYEVPTHLLKTGDVIVNTYGEKADHMMLYLGDEHVLHHLYNRLSRVEFLHSYYRRKISKVFRHMDWENGMIEAVFNDIEAANG